MKVHDCKEAEVSRSLTDYDMDSIDQASTMEALRNAKIPNWGHAIGKIVFLAETRQWATTNSEYTSIISFCPFCGKNLKEQ